MKTPEQIAFMIRNTRSHGAKRGEKAKCPVCDEIFTGRHKARQMTCCNQHGKIYKKAIAIFNSQNKKNLEDMFSSLVPDIGDGNANRWLSVCGDYVRGVDHVLGF